MELLPESIAKTMPVLYEQESKGDEAIVHLKFFDPCGSWMWYATEFDGKDIFFGLVIGHEEEFGYFSLHELQSYKGPLGLGIERDLYFKPISLSELKEELNMGC